MGILTKLALLSWLVTLVTMTVFVAVILPSQKRAFLDNLESKARGVSVSLQDVAAGAVVTEDYSVVVDHCMGLIEGDRTVELLVLTRNDGFSLIHTRNGWRSEQRDLGGHADARTVSRGIGTPGDLDREVFQYSRPFDYSGIEWGWISVGLSLDAYRANVKAMYTRTAFAAALCLLMGLAASVVYAKRIVTPILRLRDAARRVTEGDLGARAAVGTGDEVGDLAHAFNTMTQAVQDREARMRVQNQQLASLVADEAFHAGDIAEVARRVTEAGAETLGVERVGLWLLSEDRSVLECVDQYSSSGQSHTGGEVLEHGPCQAFLWALEGLRAIAASDAVSDPRTSCLAEGYLKPRGVGAVLDAAVRLGGRVEGAICHEHVGGRRNWTLEEENFAGSVADLLALALEARDRLRAQEEAVAAKEAAEAASDAKSQFLANMSHEIRTPINGVMGMLQLLEQEELSAPQQRYVRAALSSADSLLTIIGDVLDFSKIEVGRLELDRSPFSLRDAVDRAVRLFAERAEIKNVELSYSVSPELPEKLVGDSNRLQQVLVNLVGNAVKFTETGGIHVESRLVECSSTDVVVRWNVRDTGPGVPAEQRAVIFESFAQGDMSMQRRHGGTGLGLAISRHLVRLMGGEIGVESSNAEGSVFWFTARLERQQGQEGPGPGLQPVETAGSRLLVVDDSPATRTVVRDCCHRWGYEVSEAADAAEAMVELRLAADANEPYAIAVIDHHLPGIDGFDLAKLIRDDPRLEGTRFVLLSGFREPAAALLAEHRFAAAVPKPVRASDLYDAISSTAAGGPVEVGGTSEGSGGDVLGSAGVRPHVLLVEDNAINRDVAQGLVERLGCSCECLSTGKGAVEAVASGRFDLVLMDCQMPGVDGYEATARIRKWEEKNRPNARIPVIALTAHAMSGDRERCLAAGMDDYLSKPIVTAELADRLTRWLGLERGSQAPTVTPPAGADRLPDGAGSEHSVEHEREILARCQGDRSLAARLLREFVAQTAEDLTSISRAAAEGDPDRVARSAHRIKGAAGNLALGEVAAIAAELCQLSRGGSVDGVETLVVELEKLVDHVAGRPSLCEGVGRDA